MQGTSKVLAVALGFERDTRDLRWRDKSAAFPKIANGIFARLSNRTPVYGTLS
jgi:hypothetical protein